MTRIFVHLLKKVFYANILLLCFFVGNIFADSSGTELRLEIFGGGLSIWSPANYDIGTITPNSEGQVITGQFLDYFWLEDLNGYDNGYYTTIQSKGLKSQFGYSLTGIYFKKNNLEKILGTDNPKVQLNNNFSDYFQINDPVVFIYRNPAPNLGIISLYGDMPFIKIFIPGYTPTGVYTGTITYTLFVN